LLFFLKLYDFWYIHTVSLLVTVHLVINSIVLCQLVMGYPVNLVIGLVIGFVLESRKLSSNDFNYLKP